MGEFDLSLGAMEGKRPRKRESSMKAPQRIH